jgi:deoxyribodipyrimidine photo-lyase
VRILNDRPANERGRYVLYWSQIYRRGEDNLALELAVQEANQRRLPVLFYEALRPDYPFASDRFHTFVLEGARDTRARLKQRGIAHAVFLPRTPDQARGMLAKLAKHAALIVSDDFPTFIVPAQNAAAAKRADCTYIVVDDNAAVPLSTFPKQEFAARTIRPKIHKALKLEEVRDASAKVKMRELDLPFDPEPLDDIPAAVKSCAIDHDVFPVELPGGSRAAEERLERFVKKKLRTYPEDRNDPSRDATSGLSPYLHFGMISARKILLRVKDEERSEAFVEQLLVRRGLAFNFARYCPDHASYAGVPEWARKTLAEHAKDKRVPLTLEELDAAETPDELWNAAQRQLKATGIIHNYVRMLWGKLPLLWMQPAEAHAALVHLNDRYALDGRDPDGYTNISWCFGLHDRPWPEAPVFGKVRRMTSASARRKLDLEDYLTRWR